MSTMSVVSLDVSLVMSPAVAHTHERWFVQDGRHAGEHVWIGPPGLLLVLAGIGFVLLMLLVHRVDLVPAGRALLDRAGRRLPAGIEWRLVAALSGLMLLAHAVTGVFLAPEFVLPGTALVATGGVGQAVIGLLLLSQRSFLLSGVLILVIAVPLATVYFRADFLVHYGFEYVGLAVALVLVGLSGTCRDRVATRVCRWMQRRPCDFRDLPLPVIRIGLGLTFAALALHCKLIDPNITLTFLDQYDLNFMRQLGVPGFTNRHFVFAAFVGETTLGLTLALGMATRFVAGVLLVALLSTLAVLGPVELVGHLPIIAIVLLLLARGAGAYTVPRTVAASPTRFRAVGGRRVTEASLAVIAEPTITSRATPDR